MYQSVSKFLSLNKYLFVFYIDYFMIDINDEKDNWRSRQWVNVAVHLILRG